MPFDPNQSILMQSDRTWKDDGRVYSIMDQEAQQGVSNQAQGQPNVPGRPVPRPQPAPPKPTSSTPTPQVAVTPTPAPQFLQNSGSSSTQQQKPTPTTSNKPTYGLPSPLTGNSSSSSSNNQYNPGVIKPWQRSGKQRMAGDYMAEFNKNNYM